MEETESGGECLREMLGQMMELTGQPPLETVCPEIVNMILEWVEVRNDSLLHFISLTVQNFDFRSGVIL